MRIPFVPIIFAVTAGCSSNSDLPLPPIADKLPSDVQEAQRVFDHRVKAAFELGTSETDTIATLQNSGFGVGPKREDGYRSANIGRNNGICKTLWSVRWKAAGGVITEIFGVYGLHCP